MLMFPQLNSLGMLPHPFKHHMTDINLQDKHTKMVLLSFLFQNISTFTLETSEDGREKMETGKGKCPFEPSQHYTAVMAGMKHTHAYNDNQYKSK